MAFCVLKVHMICEHMKENINQSVYVKRQGQIIQSSNNVDFLPTNAPVCIKCLIFHNSFMSDK